MRNLAIAASLLLLAGPATAQNSRESAQLLKVLPQWNAERDYVLWDICQPLASAIRNSWGEDESKAFLARLGKVYSEVKRTECERFIDSELRGYLARAVSERRDTKNRVRSLKYAEMQISLIRLGYFFRNE